MAKSLSTNQPSSSVCRLLDRRAAARATQPAGVPFPPAANAAASSMNGSVLTGVPPTAFDAHAGELKCLLDHYNYLYGVPSQLSFGFKAFANGQVDDRVAAPPIFRERTGGKVMLEVAILLAYARRHGIPLFVIDPDGAFARAVRTYRDHPDLPVPLLDLIEHCCNEVRVVDASMMQLDRWDLFEQLLAASPFFESLQVRSVRKVRAACAALIEQMRDANLPLHALNHRASFMAAWELLSDRSFCHNLYARGGAAAGRFMCTLEETDREELFWRVWIPLCEPFRETNDADEQPRMAIPDLIAEPLQGRMFATVFDLSVAASRTLAWNDDVRSLLIRRLLDGVRDVSETLFEHGGRTNALVAVSDLTSVNPSPQLLDLLQRDYNSTAFARVESISS